jgi:pimeloyl-ACP methyl ester carboxylesterase
MSEIGAMNWKSALTVKPRSDSVIVEGVPIAYHSWGEGSSPLMFVHGGLAQGHWWDHIAPCFPERRTVAIDLTGHGDSGYRGRYSVDQWAREITAVIRHAQLERPILVGHSMGGVPAVAAAVQQPDHIQAVITVDTRFNDAGWPGRDKPSPVFSSLEEGMSRFAPAHHSGRTPVPPEILRHIARTSLRQQSGGWRWKRDDSYHIESTPLRDLLPRLTTPFGLVRTTHGVVTAEMADEMCALVPGRGITATIADAGHNPMLEQPTEFLRVLRALITDESRSVNQPVG